MLYYVIKNEDGFEELVFEGTMEEAEAKPLCVNISETLSTQ